MTDENDEACTWEDFGLHPSEEGFWRYNGWSAEYAAPWIGRRFRALPHIGSYNSPRVASSTATSFRDAGYPAPREPVLWDNTYWAPEDLPKWCEQGYTMADLLIIARANHARGAITFSSEYAKTGASAEAIASAITLGVAADEVLHWDEETLKVTAALATPGGSTVASTGGSQRTNS